MRESMTPEFQIQVEVPVAFEDPLRSILEEKGLDGVSELLVEKGFSPKTIEAYLAADPRSREFKFGTPSEATPENFLARLTTVAERKTKEARKALDVVVRAEIEYDPRTWSRRPEQMKASSKNARDYYDVWYHESTRLHKVYEHHKQGNDVPLREEVDFHQGFAFSNLSMSIKTLDESIALPNLLRPEQFKDLQISLNPSPRYSSQQRSVILYAARVLDLASEYMVLKRVASQLRPLPATQNLAS